MSKSTNLIYFHGGCYGTFIEWTCYYFSNYIKDLPFTDNGSSHNYVGNFLVPPEVFFEYVSSNKDEKFARCHPALFNDDKAFLTYNHNNCYYDIHTADFLCIQKEFNNILVPHPTPSTFLWMENNVFQKCTIPEEVFDTYSRSYGYCRTFFANAIAVSVEDKIKILLEQEMEPDKFMQWGKSSLVDFEIWELRELMAYYWFGRHKDLFTCWDRLANEFPKIKFIPLDSFKNSPVDAILSYLEFFNVPLPPKESISDIVNQWKLKQIHMNKDEIVAKIIKSIINKENFDWANENLTIIDEAYIQKLLLDNGINIKCFGLNEFPTNTIDFLTILE
jgi:hypothetical protein